MRTNFLKVLMLIGTALLLGNQTNAQSDEKQSYFKATADIVSQYVWRGSLATAHPTPNIQPTLAFTSGNFEVGVWGSTDFTGSYKEIDPYIAFTFSKIKLGITDYNWNFDQAGYFNYKNSETGHRLEGTVGFTGTDKLPVGIYWNTMFYGLDKQADDSTKQAYSTYIEFVYTKGDVNAFLGLTPWESYYNNYGISAFDSTATKKTFSVVNIGASYTKSLKINENISLPVKVTLVINPAATYSLKDYIHLVFGISI
jgi:hypothetical protein